MLPCICILSFCVYIITFSNCMSYTYIIMMMMVNNVILDEVNSVNVRDDHCLCIYSTVQYSIKFNSINNVIRDNMYV